MLWQAVVHLQLGFRTGSNIAGGKRKRFNDDTFAAFADAKTAILGLGVFERQSPDSAGFPICAGLATVRLCGSEPFPATSGAGRHLILLQNPACDYDRYILSPDAFP